MAVGTLSGVNAGVAAGAVVAAAAASVAGARAGDGTPEGQAQDGYQPANPAPASAAALMATGHRPAASQFLTGQVSNPFLQLAEGVQEKGINFGHFTAHGVAIEISYDLADTFPALTDTDPLQVLQALITLSQKKGEFLHALHAATHPHLLAEWARILGPIRAIVISDSSPMFLKDVALRVLEITDTEFATQYWGGLLLRPQDTVPATLREWALSAFGRLPSVPGDIAPILQRTASDASLPLTTRMAAIRGLSHPPFLQFLADLAITDTEGKIYHVVYDSVRSVLRQFGNGTPEALAALERVQSHFYSGDLGQMGRSQGLSTVWEERAVPLLAAHSVSGQSQDSYFLYHLADFRDNPNIAAAVAALLAYPDARVRGFVMSFFFPIWGIDLAVGAVALLDHAQADVRSAAETVMRRAGVPVLDFDAPNAYTRNRRGELAERLVEELQRVTEPVNPNDTRIPQNRFRPTVEQLMAALVMMGLEAWEAIHQSPFTPPDPRNALLNSIRTAIVAAALPKALSQFLGDDPELQQAAGQDLITMGYNAVPGLTDIVLGTDADAATRAGELLGRMGVPAFQALTDIERRPDLPPEIRTRVRAVLEAIGASLAETWRQP